MSCKVIEDTGKRWVGAPPVDLHFMVRLETYPPLREHFMGSASLSVLVGLIGRLADKRACERTWIGLPGRTCGFLGSGETAIVG